jgi:hypothetical protein
MGQEDLGSGPTFEDTAFVRPQDGHPLQFLMHLHITSENAGLACALDFPIIRRTSAESFSVRVSISNQSGPLASSDLPASTIPASWDGTWTHFSFSPCVPLQVGTDLAFHFQDATPPHNTWPLGAGLRQARLAGGDPAQFQQQLYDLAANYNAYLDNSHQMGYRIHYGKDWSTP